MSEQRGNSKYNKRGLPANVVARYLKRLATLNYDEKTGNYDLGRSLEILAQQIRKYGDEPLLDVFQTQSKRELSRTKVRKSKLDYGVIGDMTASDVIKLMQNEELSKSDLVKLASVRFAVPHSSLMKSSRREIMDRIYSVARNELSLDAISEEAQRSGKERG